MKKHNIDIKPNQLSGDLKVSMRTRIISAIVGIIIVFPLFFLGDWFFLAFMVFATSVAMYEIIRCGKRDGSIWLYLVTIVLGIVMVNWPLFSGLVGGITSSHAYDYFSTIHISLWVLFIGICLLFLLVIIYPNFTVKDAFYVTSMVLIVSLGLQAVLFCRYFPSVLNATPRETWFNAFDHFFSSSLASYGIIGTFMTDIGAYFVGVFFGKHKLNERISPKKTVEGFFGGIFISAGISMAFAFALSAGGNSILPGVYDIEHWYNIVIVSLLMPLLATLGDFVFSAVKRSYEIKDFGIIMPGHGGILDRIDSLSFVMIGLALYTLLVFGIVNGGGLLV